MSRYITPITDRTLADIINRTAKGFINVIDLHRVYSNQSNCLNLLNIVRNFSIVLASTPDWLFPESITKILAAGELLHFVSRFETITYYSGLDGHFGIVYIDVTGYTGRFVGLQYGVGIDYLDMNWLEDQLDRVYNNIAAYYSFSSWVTPIVPTARFARTNVASCGAGMDRNNGFASYN